MRRLLFSAVFVAFALCALAQDRAADVQTAFARAQHLRHGINASIWFAQHPMDYSATYTDHETTPEDIAIMAKLGFDHVRLSVDAEPLTRAFNGWGHGDFLVRLDKAVDEITAAGMAVIVDVHPEDNYKQALRTDAGAVDRFVMLWQRLATHFGGRDPNLVFFEILNEPEVYDPYRWDGIQARAAAAIRAAAPRHTIIAAGPNYSDIPDLFTVHPLDDGNVIYNFHFYDPHEFTHQGAAWGTPFWVYEHDIPYPATEDTMADRLKQIPEPSGRYQLENYWLDHWDAHRIKLLMDEAAAWGKANNVPLTCNEFGVYRAHVDPVSRNNWIRDVRTALEADGIGWAMWDYHNGFGVAVKDKNGKSIVDPQTVEALGLAKAGNRE
ncbi:MAG TPA: cellulase family glycosylhydrolase [Terracidiphilus sp.]|nr:cellulase family glycosylhydrolase [Terracidiphilus sp.]